MDPNRPLAAAAPRTIKGDSAAALDRAAGVAFDRPVSDRPALTDKKRAARAEREARLARALRDNLRRRKEQERARDRIGPVTEGSAGLSADPLSSKSTRHGGKTID